MSIFLGSMVVPTENGPTVGVTIRVDTPQMVIGSEGVRNMATELMKWAAWADQCQIEINSMSALGVLIATPAEGQA